LKFPLLSLAILVGAAMTAAAQDAVLLNQGLSLQYTRWQVNQETANALTRIDYGFNGTMPLVDYSLGTLAFAGALDYVKASNANGSQSALGLDAYGVRVTLFPYRPFHLSLDYNHSQSLNMGGQAPLRNDVYGVALNYRGQTVQDLDIELRRGQSAQGNQSEGWSTATVNATQTFGDTRAVLMVNHQEFAATGMTFTNDFLYGNTFSRLSSIWTLSTGLSVTKIPGGYVMDTQAGLAGQFGRWLSSTALAFNRADAAGTRSTGEAAAQSFIRTEGRFACFGAVAMGSQSGVAGEASTSNGTLGLGASYNVSANWRVSLDVSASQVKGGDVSSDTPSSQHGNLRSYHVGISEGGDLPGLAQRAIFFLAERSFNRHIQEDYAPGYLPSELVLEIQQHRRMQQGSLGFTGDYYHTAVDAGGTMDWVRLSGDLKLAEGLHLFTMGDLRRDDGLSMDGVRREDRNLSVNVSERFGGSTLSGAVGFSHADQSLLTGQGAANPPGAVEGSGAARFLSFSFASSVLHMPYGVLWTRYAASNTPSTTAISTHLDWSYGKVAFQISYSVFRREDGLRSSQISMNLLRAFDTIALYGFGRNW
jgi:hypothetical protein